MILLVVTPRKPFLSPQAPVSGSKKPAEDGQLIFLTAGEYSSLTTNNLTQFGMENFSVKGYLFCLQEENPC